MIKLTMQGVVKTSVKLIEQNKELFDKVDFIIGVSRGGLIPATLVSTKLNKPLITAYIDPQDNVYLDRTEWLTAKHVVVIDDAVRTGKTIQKIKNLVQKSIAPNIVNSATLYKHPSCKIDNHVAVIEKTGSIKFPWD